MLLSRSITIVSSVLLIIVTFMSTLTRLSMSLRSYSTVFRRTSKINNLSSLLSTVSKGGEDTLVSRCKFKIEKALEPIELKITSTNDDPNGSHIQVYCVSKIFEGKMLVQRQRLVYQAIWDELEGPLHAVDTVIAKTPKEAGLSE